MPSRDRVRFNLTGRNFEVSSDTYDKLERLSVKSKLMIEESRMCDPKGEVFLERDPACFAALVRFCQQGKLHLPTAVCPQVFQVRAHSYRTAIYTHTPSTAFRHLPPNSARFSYATEGALFISAQLSTDAVSTLRKVRVLIRLWKQPSAQART